MARVESASTYRKRRAVALALILGVGGVSATGVVALASRDDGRSTKTTTPKDCPTYVVKPGDTVWGIADGLSPNSDPRPKADEIIKINKIGGTLQPGRILKLPC